MSYKTDIYIKNSVFILFFILYTFSSSAYSNQKKKEELIKVIEEVIKTIERLSEYTGSKFLKNDQHKSDLVLQKDFAIETKNKLEGNENLTDDYFNEINYSFADQHMNLRLLIKTFEEQDSDTADIFASLLYSCPLSEKTPDWTCFKSLYCIKKFLLP